MSARRRRRRAGYNLIIPAGRSTGKNEAMAGWFNLEPEIREKSEDRKPNCDSSR